MTWHCVQCNLANMEQADHCRGCQAHWSKVWQQPRKRRQSRTRPKPSKENKTADKKEDAGKEEWNIFAEKPPWIPSTPAGRMTALREEAEKDTKPPMPPQPVLPPPPATNPAPVLPKQEANGLSQDELQLLTHLRGLQALGHLSEEFAQMMAKLEQKNSEASATRALSHAHLNRLNRARSQVQNLAKKVATADEEWMQFMQSVKCRIQVHIQQYQAHRQDLMTQYQGKLQELESLKIEVRQASQSLIVAPQQQETVIPTAPDVAQQLTEINTLLADQPHGLEMVDLSGPGSGDEMAAMSVPNSPRAASEEAEGAERAVKPAKGTAMKAFRSATSPNKVATNILKPKSGR